jgi:hypothetical protein
MRFYKPVHFKVEEFLPPDLYNQFGARGLELLMDSRILMTMDALRETFDVPITINNYHACGPFTQRGFRNAPGDGAALSQHRFGRACDFDIRGISAEAFREEARAGKLREQLLYVTRIEDGITWCHIDCAGIRNGEIYFFNA